MDNKYVWATEDIFSSKEEWNKTFSQIEKKLDFSKYKGKLNKKENFFNLQKQLEETSMVIEKLGVYAMMKHDENTKDSVADSMNSKVNSLYAKFSASVSFVSPELTALPESILQSYINDPDLKDYDYYLKTVLKSKAHVLSDNEEKLLAKSAEVFGSFKDIFTKIDNADLPLGKVKTKDGVIPLTHGTYSVLLQDEDQQVRKSAFKKYYKAYVSLINTISATYYGNVKKGVFVANARKYNSALQMALSNEDVNEVVYENLLQTVNDALPTLHKYMQEKKKALGVEKMHMYDIYVPTVANADIKLDYDKAYDLVVGRKNIKNFCKRRENKGG